MKEGKDEFKGDLKEDYTFLNDMKTGTLVTLTTEQHISKFLYVVLVAFVLLVILTVNFIALSTSLNMNKDSPSLLKSITGTVAFMFGFIYLIVAVFYYRLSVKNEPIVFDKDRVFPF